MAQILRFRSVVTLYKKSSKNLMDISDIENQFMNYQQVSEVVEVHMSCFHGFFLTFLGGKFLHVLYRKMLNHQKSIMIVAIDKNTMHVVGFAAGVEDLSNFYSKLIRNNVTDFAVASLKAVFRNPRIIPRLFRALTYPNIVHKTTAPACLMSLAVLAEYEGRGIGRKMVFAFLDELKRRRIETVMLTTDRDNNERTNRFYKNIGFKLSNTYVTPEKRWLCEYFLDLTKMSM